MTPDGKRIFAYCRASTKKQVDSPDTQKRLIDRYVRMQELGTVDSYFVDKATSGKVPMIEREAGREMVARIKPGDVLVIAKLDRAFRRLIDCVQILEQLERIKVKLHVCDMAGCALDLSSPMGKFVIQMFAAFAEMERNFISQRTKEGLAGKAMRGWQHSHYAGYGFYWKKVRRPDGKMDAIRVRHDGEREIMREIAMYRLETPPQSWSQIHEILEERGEITKEGKKWCERRIQRACQAEFMLQGTEQRNSR